MRLHPSQGAHGRGQRRLSQRDNILHADISSFVRLASISVR
jgi:hypothetical protein